MAANHEREPTTNFLNVDLEIRATSGLDELIEALSPAAFVLHHERGEWANFELLVEAKTPEQAIEAFCLAIKAFSPSARRLWDNCNRRCFDIGIQAGDTPRSTPFRLSAETIARVSAVNAEVGITIYGAKNCEGEAG